MNKGDFEDGPVTRYMNAESENEGLKMLLLNLTAATCPYARSFDASDALKEAHREAAGALGLGCRRLAFSYLSED